MSRHAVSWRTLQMTYFCDMLRQHLVTCLRVMSDTSYDMNLEGSGDMSCLGHFQHSHVIRLLPCRSAVAMLFGCCHVIWLLPCLSIELSNSLYVVPFCPCTTWCHKTCVIEGSQSQFIFLKHSMVFLGGLCLAALPSLMDCLLFVLNGYSYC